MVENDTVRLLRECDAGVKMGVSSIDDVLNSVNNQRLSECLNQCKEEHEKLSLDIEAALERFGDQGKSPSAMAKGMARMKTNMKLAMHESDHTIAEVMTDGCNMGVKSLSQYLNQYQAADEDSKDIAKRLIRLEEKLAVDIRGYL